MIQFKNGEDRFYLIRDNRNKTDYIYNKTTVSVSGDDIILVNPYDPNDITNVTITYTDVTLPSVSSAAELKLILQGWMQEGMNKVISLEETESQSPNATILQNIGGNLYWGGSPVATGTSSVDVQDVTIPSNGTLRLTFNDSSTQDNPMPYFADTIISGLVFSLGTTSGNYNKLNYTAGVYQNDAVVYTIASAGQFTIPNGDALNPRIDIIYGATTGGLGFVQGIAQPDPVPPSVPSGGLLLAEIGVSPGATSTVDGYTLTSVNVSQRSIISAGNIHGQTLYWNSGTSRWTNTSGILTNGTNTGIGITTQINSQTERLALNGRMIILDSSAPATTTNKLYATSGNLYWNGIRLDVAAAPLDPGTAANQTLRWDGTKWDNATNFLNDGSSSTTLSLVSGDISIETYPYDGNILISAGDSGGAGSGNIQIQYIDDLINNYITLDNNSFTLISNDFTNINSINMNAASNITIERSDASNTANIIVTSTDITTTNLISSSFVRVSDTSDATEGNIRFDGTNFQGYKSGVWVNLDESGGAGTTVDAGTVDGQTLYWDSVNDKWTYSNVITNNISTNTVTVTETDGLESSQVEINTTSISMSVVDGDNADYANLYLSASNTVIANIDGGAKHTTLTLSGSTADWNVTTDSTDGSINLEYDSSDVLNKLTLANSDIKMLIDKKDATYTSEFSLQYDQFYTSISDNTTGASLYIAGMNDTITFDSNDGTNYTQVRVKPLEFTAYSTITDIRAGNSTFGMFNSAITLENNGTDMLSSNDYLSKISFDSSSNAMIEVSVTDTGTSDKGNLNVSYDNVFLASTDGTFSNYTQIYFQKNTSEWKQTDGTNSITATLTGGELEVVATDGSNTSSLRNLPGGSFYLLGHDSGTNGSSIIGDSTSSLALTFYDGVTSSSITLDNEKIIMGGGRVNKVSVYTSTQVVSFNESILVMDSASPAEFAFQTPTFDGQTYEVMNLGAGQLDLTASVTFNNVAGPVTLLTGESVKLVYSTSLSTYLVFYK